VLWSGAALDEHRRLLSQREPVLIRGQVRTDRQGYILVMGQSVMPVEDAQASKRE
jgi:hypothetical protein